MFKNRLFLYGLGLGLIAGAVLLQLMMKVDDLENGALTQTMTMEQLQAQADKLNAKIVPKEQTVYSGKDIEAVKQKAIEDERNKLAAQNASAPPPPTATIKTVYISELMNAYQVADMFVKAGILSDAPTLVSSLSQKKLTTRIRAGSYSFPESATVDDIIAKITIAM